MHQTRKMTQSRPPSPSRRASVPASCATTATGNPSSPGRSARSQGVRTRCAECEAEIAWLVPVGQTGRGGTLDVGAGWPHPPPFTVRVGKAGACGRLDDQAESRTQLGVRADLDGWTGWLVVRPGDLAHRGRVELYRRRAGHSRSSRTKRRTGRASQASGRRLAMQDSNIVTDGHQVAARPGRGARPTAHANRDLGRKDPA